MAAPTKDTRMTVRLRSTDDQLIRQAAAHVGQSVTDFVTSAAIERAHDVLAEHRELVVDEACWEAFTALLDRPARPDPRLVELCARPQRVDR